MKKKLKKPKQFWRDATHMEVWSPGIAPLDKDMVRHVHGRIEFMHRPKDLRKLSAWLLVAADYLEGMGVK